MCSTTTFSEVSHTSQSRWKENGTLLNYLLELQGDFAFEKSIAVAGLLGKLFPAETDELLEEMAPDILEALINIFRSEEEESAQIILQLLIPSLMTIMTRKDEMGLAFVKEMDAMGMEDGLATLCDECSGTACTLLMRPIQLMKGAGLIFQKRNQCLHNRDFSRSMKKRNDFVDDSTLLTKYGDFSECSRIMTIKCRLLPSW
jgi:hypothetical protein